MALVGMEFDLAYLCVVSMVLATQFELRLQL
jgi:hypothetical protein